MIKKPTRATSTWSTAARTGRCALVYLLGFIVGFSPEVTLAADESSVYAPCGRPWGEPILDRPIAVHSLTSAQLVGEWETQYQGQPIVFQLGADGHYVTYAFHPASRGLGHWTRHENGDWVLDRTPGRTGLVLQGLTDVVVPQDPTVATAEAMIRLCGGSMECMLMMAMFGLRATGMPAAPAATQPDSIPIVAASTRTLTLQGEGVPIHLVRSPREACRRACNGYMRTKAILDHPESYWEGYRLYIETDRDAKLKVVAQQVRAEAVELLKNARCQILDQLVPDVVELLVARLGLVGRAAVELNGMYEQVKTLQTVTKAADKLLRSQFLLQIVLESGVVRSSSDGYISFVQRLNSEQADLLELNADALYTLLAPDNKCTRFDRDVDDYPSTHSFPSVPTTAIELSHIGVSEEFWQQSIDNARIRDLDEMISCLSPF